MQEKLAAYLAGFLDGDGSIHIQLIRQAEYRYGFYLRVSVSFHQHRTGRTGLEWIHSQLKAGYLRNREKDMSDYIITSRPVIRELLKAIAPYVVFKKRQVEQALEILDAIDQINSPETFLNAARKAESFSTLNRSKKRTNTLRTVLDAWNDMGRHTPVTTDSKSVKADVDETIISSSKIG